MLILEGNELLDQLLEDGAEPHDVTIEEIDEAAYNIIKKYCKDEHPECSAPSMEDVSITVWGKEMYADFTLDINE